MEDSEGEEEDRFGSRTKEEAREGQRKLVIGRAREALTGVHSFWVRKRRRQLVQ